jgi:Skp family chaperone for outer membrane proteins
MKKTLTVGICLITAIFLTVSLTGFAQEDFSTELLIKELQRAEKLIKSGEIVKGLDSLLGVRSILDSNIRELSEATDEEVNLGLPGMDLKIGFVNAQEAFTVFTDAVEEEREKAKQKNEELVGLREKVLKGEISESKYKRERDILQAEKLKAQLEIDVAMLDKMLQAEGFQSISDRLFSLKDQVTPITNELDKVLDEIRQGTAVPEEVSQKLSQIHTQYEQLDGLLTRLIESKIFQITNQRAQEEGYDIVLRQENVVLYRNSDRVDDLTDMTKQALREEIGGTE